MTGPNQAAIDELRTAATADRAAARDAHAVATLALVQAQDRLSFAHELLDRAEQLERTAQHLEQQSTALPWLTA